MTEPDPSLDNRSGLPEDLRRLLASYPRDGWRTHANLGEMAKFWLSRHDMFRELGGMLDAAGEGLRARDIGTEEFARFFPPRLEFFLQQLHVHHHVEDDHYFPIFRRADRRLLRGFDILERDHHMLAAGIQSCAGAANDFLRALQGPRENINGAAEVYLASGAQLLRRLVRHLEDEEDLIVPLILDRGEESLGVAP